VAVRRWLIVFGKVSGLDVEGVDIRMNFWHDGPTADRANADPPVLRCTVGFFAQGARAGPPAAAGGPARCDLSGGA